MTSPADPSPPPTARDRALAGAFRRALRDGAFDRDTFGESDRRLYRIALTMFGIYLLVAVGIYLWRGIWFTPDRWAVFLLVGALLLGRLGSFVRDWVPFVLLIFGYEFLRGIAGRIVVGDGRVWQVPRDALPQVKLEGLIAADRALLAGHDPIVWLQRRLHSPGDPQWWDFLALIVYSLHFVLPCGFAFLLWLTQRRRFWLFTLAFCAMTYSAFAFFLLVPAAPPWLAQRWGITGGYTFPQNDVLGVIQPEGFRTLDMLAIWGEASPNPVAAFPSLHASFPWLVLLFALRWFGPRGLWFLTWNVGVWFAVLYTANHWVVDILAGIAWASAAFVAVSLAQVWLEGRDGGWHLSLPHRWRVPDG